MSRRTTRRSPLLFALLMAMQLVVGCGNKNKRTEPQIQVRASGQAASEEQATTRVLVNGTNVTIHHHDGSVTQLGNVDPEDTVVVEAPGKVEIVRATGTQTVDPTTGTSTASTGSSAITSSTGASTTTTSSSPASPTTTSSSSSTSTTTSSGTPTTTAATRPNGATTFNGIPVQFDGGVPTADSTGTTARVTPQNLNPPPGSNTNLTQTAGTGLSGTPNADGFVGQTANLGDSTNTSGVAGAPS